ncbi:MAG TPA: CHAP domain-containing protein [Nitrospira sp.]|nr:CHAP domain-containing protein [Nitrospira sp.]
MSRFSHTLCTLLVGAALSACAAPASQGLRQAVTPLPDCCRTTQADLRKQAIVQTAVNLVGAKTIESQGRRISYDCAGVTRAIYLAHGIDLFEGGAVDGKANGVGLIYNHLRKHGQLHRGPVVQAGDLVFFDNTWDYNGDGLVNDPLTHVGIVERVESNGTIVFISRVAGAIERYRMNVAHPHIHRTADGRLLNDYMRRKHWRDGEQTPYLTGELFAAFGTRVVESASSPDRR